MCSECLLLLEECPDLTAVQEVYQSIEVVNAYTLLDDATSLADKVQSFFAQNVVTETHDVLKHLLLEGEDAQTALKKSRFPYRDLCMQLPEEKFRPFLCKTLEVLFDLMCLYHTTMTWHRKTESAEIKFPAEDQAICSNGNHHHRRSGSHGDLSQIVKESRHVRTESHSGELFAIPMSPTSVHASRMLSRSGSRRRSFSDKSEMNENGTFASGDFDGKFLGESGISDNLAKREEIVSITVARALERGRKTVWELAARRVAAFLSNDAVFLTSPEQFLQSLDWVNKFILAGEAFCGTEAVSLRTKLTKQGEQYFGAYHCQNLEVLRMIVEKELWQPLSSLALKSVELAGLTGHGLSLAPTSVLGESPGAPQRPSSPSSGHGMTGFAEWLERGNPFAEKSQHRSAIPKVTDEDAVRINGIDKVGLGANDSVKVEEEEDNEDEDLLADFIDEDSQLPGRLYNNFQHSAMRSKRDQGSNEDKNLVLTNSSVNILRHMNR
uniref:Vacuolar protein sorting-associated protein 54 N-terminal domain-containing protein n=1 Tax=Physcomitrium patens TaxID=3218 RepID=A0A2K1IDX2_PHYPA|nr:hypothetical protein PHYPA_029619 [Physcomitrium patens]